ncbi:MAG TPA: ATP-binding protein [Afipia sp.]
MKGRDRFEASLTDEGRYRLLIEAVTDYAIYMLDPKGIITSWNPGAERLKGYTASEIVGSHFSKFYSDEDRNAGLPERALFNALTYGRHAGEGWRVRKNGSRFWADVIIDPIRSPAGEFVGYAKITRDLSERREAQLALERTREVLYQAQKMEAIGQLTGGVAHDFNNLLMAILGSLELVRKRLPDDPKITPLIQNAIRGAQRGATLTQRMLAFARRQELEIRALDVKALVGDISDLMQSSLGPMVTLEIHFPDVLPAVRADANQLEMALLNLAVNSRDAMPSGGAVTITARDETVVEDKANHIRRGRYVCLSVTDTGEGMDDATLARATEPFFTTKGVGKGTGLGLSMVHGLAEQFGGRFVLKSKPNGGTTAEIWLPAASSAVTAAADLPATHRANGRSLNVLAVDDDGLVLMNTTAMLEDLGHIVFEATSGRQALAILQERSDIDLVITDQAMPVMTGSQLAEAIHAQRPNLPIILATGYAELPAGVALPKLAKPFLQDDLAQAVRAQFPG